MPTINADLKPASVDEAHENILDPVSLPPKGGTVRINPWTPDMKYRDRVTLFFYDTEIDYIPIAQSAIDEDVVFIVPAQTFIDNAQDGVVWIRYEVQFESVGTPQKSPDLLLRLSAGFDADAVLDLTANAYVIAAEKPPHQAPEFARLIREANWGTAPHRFSSSNEDVASVTERTGEVTARRNGVCTISAIDSSTPPQTQGYLLTIKGIQELHFLSHDASWDGMKNACAAAGLEPVSLVQIKQLWRLYKTDLPGSVGDYLGWLPYPVWTGTELGAATAWIYNLHGDSENGNASSSDTDANTRHQALGISRP